MNIPLTPIRCLKRAVELYGEKEAVVCGASRFTYREFGERCRRLAAGLLGQGVEPGDRVAWLSFNRNELLEAYFGVPLAGAVLLPLNVRLHPGELAQILAEAQPSLLIWEPEFTAVVETLAGTEGARFRHCELLDRLPLDPPDLLSIDENAPAELFYTSGTTGSPKGVLLSHRTLYLHALNAIATLQPKDWFVHLYTIPLFHANGWGCPHTVTLSGGKHVLQRRFEPAEVFRLIERERVTNLYLVPAMAHALLAHPMLGAHDLSSVLDVHLGGAASSPELAKALEARFRCQVGSGYGLTESSPMATFARPKATADFVKAWAGWPVYGTEVRVVDERGEDVARDSATMGEVVIRGDGVADGTANGQGWLETGDLAVWDGETCIEIVDRRKDIIVSGGENISSLQLERAIASHPAVLECAVVAAPDAKWGETPVAIVVLRDGHSLEPADLLAHLAERVARFQLPKIIEFRETALPKTASGKIRKQELREPFWAGKERRVQG